MRRGSIYLANFPFGNTAGMKLRPVLLLTPPIGASAEVIVAYISSVIPSVLLPSDVVLDPQTPERPQDLARIIHDGISVATPCGCPRIVKIIQVIRTAS